MMTAQKKSKTRPASGLAPLAPEAEAVLQAQVELVAAACEAGRDLESLRKLVTVNPHEPLWDLHLMAALSDIAHPAIPPLLAALFSQAADKARRKALKKALHLLRTRGVPVPDELLPREEPVMGQAKPVATKAMVSLILGNGDSFVVLESPREVLGGNVLVAIINDVAGLRECYLLNLNNRQKEELWEHYRRQGLTDWFLVPGPYAVKLLDEAYRGKENLNKATRAYGEVRNQVWANWGRPEAAPDLEQATPITESGERSRVLEQSIQLAADPLFQTWRPAPEAIAPWIGKMEEIDKSPLVLTDQQKAARADALLNEATRTIYPPEMRPLWGRRMLAMAYYLELSERPDDARLARAVADELRQPEQTSLAGENPFLANLVKVSLTLALMAAQKSQEPREPGGLLSLPGDAPLIRR